MKLPEGARIGPYEVLGLLGAGGMGEVYRARDTRLNRPVAIKIITDSGTDPHAVRRFESEALSASALNHPNILTVHEFGLHEGLHYLVTEFVEGETLRERVRRGPLPIDDALDIAIQIATGLEGAHAAGLVHRDIKPENVMLRPDGYVKILDFGLAKLSPTATASASTDTISMRTTPGMLVGTIGYMAPEQVRGLPIDERADVWSLGIVLHEMLTGVAPFEGATMSDVIASILERQPPSLAEAGATVPSDLDWIVSKALAKDRAQRYQTIREILIDLRRLKQRTVAGVDRGSVSSRGLTPGFLRRRWLALALGVVLVSTLGLGTLVWQQTRFTGTPPSSAPAVTPSHTFNYWLTVQEFRDGKAYDKPFESSGQETFRNGWQFKLNLASDEPGFLYLLNEGPAADGKPTLRWLYPAPSQSAATAAGRTVQTGWYTFDQNPGAEQFWIVWSTREVPELERSRLNTTPPGDVKDPQEAVTVQSLLRTKAAGVHVEKNKATEHSVVRGNADILAILAVLKHR